MSINCVKLRFGEAEVKVAGSHDDLAEVAFELLQRMSKLHPIMNQHSVDFSCENDNLDSISSNDSSESNVTVHNSYSGTSVQQMARHRNCNTGSQLALVACEYLHFVKRNKIFSRKEILSAMRDSVTFYKDSDSGNLTKIGTVWFLVEIQNWAKKRFQGILKSPENASRNQAMPQSSIYFRLETINEPRRL